MGGPGGRQCPKTMHPQAGGAAVHALSEDRGGPGAQDGVDSTRFLTRHRCASTVMATPVRATYNHRARVVGATRRWAETRPVQPRYQVVSAAGRITVARTT